MMKNTHDNKKYQNLGPSELCEEFFQNFLKKCGEYNWKPVYYYEHNTDTPKYPLQIENKDGDTIFLTEYPLIEEMLCSSNVSILIDILEKMPEIILEIEEVFYKKYLTRKEDESIKLDTITEADRLEAA